MKDLINWDLIDKDDVSKRLFGNIDLLKKLLINYYENHNDLRVEIEELIKSENYDEMSKLVHKIKGVSANLSMKKLNSASIELECAIKEKSYNNILNLKGDFINSHNEIISMIKGLI